MEQRQLNSYVVLEVNWGRESLTVGWSIIVRRQFNLKFSVSATIKTMPGEDIVIMHQDVFNRSFFEWAEGGVRPIEMVREFPF